MGSQQLGITSALPHTINNMKFLVFFVACLAMVLSLVECAPFNAEGPFYNGDMASAPSFDIKEHLWPGLTVKQFSLGENKPGRKSHRKSHKGDLLLLSILFNTYFLH